MHQSQSQPQIPRLIDIGINLCHDRFDTDRNQVLERAQAAGVEHLIVTGSCAPSNRAALALSKAHPERISATAGIHPHHAEQTHAETWPELETLCAHPQVKAVGETGLDFFRHFSDPKIQVQVFERHLELAVANQKPLFLHQRDAHKTFLPILKTYRPEISRGVVHCFTDSKQALFDYLDLDMHIGITGWICDDQRGAHLRDLVKNIPGDRLMIETDGPYLLPKNLQPKPKSRRNEPKYLPHIAQYIAHCCGISFERLANQTRQTAQTFFDI